MHLYQEANIHVGGCYLRDERERRAAVDFLEMMGHKTNWRTSGIVFALQQEWICLDKEA